MAAQRIRLRLLHTSDLHGALRGFDYLSDRPSAVIGLTRTATLIRDARAEAATDGTACLLFDTGDALQGSPLCDIADDRPPALAAHPMIAALNALDCDAMAIGNHDMDYGPASMLRALGDARFPVLAANLFRVGPQGTTAPGPLPPRVTLTRRVRDTDGAAHDLRICVIGCLPPQTLDWNREATQQYHITDMVDAVAAQAAQARAEGCDLVVALAHTGLDPAVTGPQAENAGLRIAALDDVDAVLAGHNHLPFPLPPGTPPRPGTPVIEVGNDGCVDGTPITNPGAWGAYLGVIDLTLERGNPGQSATPAATPLPWRVARTSAALRPIVRREEAGQIVHTTAEDPAMLALTQGAHDLTRATLAARVGRTDVPLHSYFSLIGPDAGLSLVGEAMRDHLRTRLAGTPHADLPVVAAVSPLKSGRRAGPEHFTDIPAGPLTRRHISDLLYYENTFCAIAVTGAFLREWLEISASLFNRLTPGKASDAPIFRSGVPGYAFDVIHGLTYEIDLSAPPRYGPNTALIDPGARRIRNLRHRDRPIADGDRIAVATHGYRIYGVGFPALAGIPRPDVIPHEPLSNRAILTAHVARNDRVRPDQRPGWRFAPLGGASALFHTGPAARAHLGEAGLPPLEHLGSNPRGFAVFRVTL